jgi:hypothetical protein
LHERVVDLHRHHAVALGPPAIEVCNGGACKRVQTRAPQPAIVGSLRSVTVIPDGHTVFAGFGSTPEGDQAIERYDLDQPAAAPRRLDHPGGCGEILGVFAGKLLVQTTGCIENTGARVLVTPSGRIVANLGTYVLGDAVHALGSDRWLFEGHESFAIWDLAAGKRVTIAKGGEHFGRRAALIGGEIVAVDGDGTITGYSAKLERKPLGAIPRCP